jgi:hypothetical protein
VEDGELAVESFDDLLGLLRVEPARQRGRARGWPGRGRRDGAWGLGRLARLLAFPLCDALRLHARVPEEREEPRDEDLRAQPRGDDPEREGLPT